MEPKAPNSRRPLYSPVWTVSGTAGPTRAPTRGSSALMVPNHTHIPTVVVHYSTLSSRSPGPRGVGRPRPRNAEPPMLRPGAHRARRPSGRAVGGGPLLHLQPAPGSGSWGVAGEETVSPGVLGKLCNPLTPSLLLGHFSSPLLKWLSS